MARAWIGQLVRRNGTVLTHVMLPDCYGPPQYDIPETPGFEIIGETFGRWRYTDRKRWTVTHYWPDGPTRGAWFVAVDAGGDFLPLFPGDKSRPRSIARGLRHG